jgi:metal-responsive CopG/Arc/MetJ family transcriptional regulator
MNDQLTIRLPGKLLRELARRAKEQGVPKSQVVRDALAAYVVGPRGEPAESGWRRVRGLAGSIELDHATVEADDIASRIREHNWRNR